MKYIISKTHAKNANGLYKRGDVYEGKDIEGLQYKIEGGYIEQIDISTKEDGPIDSFEITVSPEDVIKINTKEEKKTRKRR